jgi:hypothetical protein
LDRGRSLYQVTQMGQPSVEETEGYLHRDRARHARAMNHLDARVTV